MTQTPANPPPQPKCGARCRRGRCIVVMAVVVVALVIGQGALRTATGPANGSELQGAAAADTARRTTLRVGTFNIAGGVGESGREDLARTAANLQDLDLIGLEEVHGNLALSEDNQARELGHKLGLAWLFAPTENRWWHEHFGNGVLSRVPISYWMRLPLPCTQHRGFRNVVLLKVPFEGRSLNVLVTHLDRERDATAQRRAIGELFLSVAQPAILMGDLNCGVQDPQIQRLRSTPGVVDALGAALGEKISDHIDWIFLRGLRCVKAGTRDNGASDHPAVWAEVEAGW